MSSGSTELRDVDVDVDVLVAGAGSAGCAAAISAARSGARTLLVEVSPTVGGTSTAVLDTFYAFYTAGEPRRLVGGLGWELVERLLGEGEAILRPNSFGSGQGVTYSPEALRLLWETLLAHAGVTVLVAARPYAAVRDDGSWRVSMAARGGPVTVEAGTIIDCTGDGELSTLAGGQALDDVALVQPATLTFRVAGVDVPRAFGAPDRRPLKAYIAEAYGHGYDLPAMAGSMHATTSPGVVHVAMTRVTSPDPDDPASLHTAIAGARGQVAECLRLLRDRVPGFASAFLVSTSPGLGIRETRRVRGSAVLHEADVLGAVLPDDRIALCGAPIEDLSGPSTRWVHVPEPGYYGVPYAALRVAGVPDALVAGRCVSADHGAHSSVRSMGTCIAMGEAAGVAAALAVSSGGLDAVDVSQVQKTLRSQGALLDGPA